MSAPRKIVQIATTSWGDAQEMTPDLYALCDDGSVWNFILGPSPHWKRMSRIPQPGYDGHAGAGEDAPFEASND
jgi:hypothetical protein